MKKRIFAAIMIVALVLSGCGAPKKPDGIHEISYGIGQSALEKYDEYTKGSLSKDELYQELHDLRAKLDDQDFSDDPFYDVSNMIISSDIMNIAAMLNSGTASDVSDQVEDLKHYLETGSTK